MPSVLSIDKRCRKQRRLGTQVVIPKGRNGIHDTRRQPRERGIENSIARPNTALPTRSENLLQNPPIETRRIGNTESRREIMSLRWRNRARNSRIARYNQTSRRLRIEDRLPPRYDRLHLVVFFPERHDVFPTQTEIKRQVTSHPPAILHKKSRVSVAQVKRLARRLGEITRNAD